MSLHPGHHMDKCKEHGTVISQCGCIGNGPKPLTEFPCHRKFSCHPDYQKPEPLFPMDVPGSKPPYKPTRLIEALGPDTYEPPPREDELTTEADDAWNEALKGLTPKSGETSGEAIRRMSRPHQRLTPTTDPGPVYKFCHGCHDTVGPTEEHACPLKFKSGLPDGYGVRSLYIRTETED